MTYRYSARFLRLDRTNWCVFLVVREAIVWGWPWRPPRVVEVHTTTVMWNRNATLWWMDETPVEVDKLAITEACAQALERSRWEPAYLPAERLLEGEVVDGPDLH